MQQEQAQQDRWQEHRSFTEFFQEGHIEVSRGLDDEFRAWLSEHTGEELGDVERLDVLWRWEMADPGGRPVTVATVVW